MTMPEKLDFNEWLETWEDKQETNEEMWEIWCELQWRTPCSYDKQSLNLIQAALRYVPVMHFEKIAEEAGVTVEHLDELNNSSFQPAGSTWEFELWKDNRKRNWLIEYDSAIYQFHYGRVLPEELRPRWYNCIEDLMPAQSFNLTMRFEIGKILSETFVDFGSTEGDV